MARRAEVDVVICESCLGDATITDADIAELDLEIEMVQHLLQKANHAWSFEKMRQGAKTITESALLEHAKGVIGSTRLNVLRKAGEFPEPMKAGTKNIWVMAEALDGLAAIAARDTEAATKKIAPMNRYQTRKAEAVAKLGSER